MNNVNLDLLAKISGISVKDLKNKSDKEIQKMAVEMGLPAAGDDDGLDTAKFLKTGNRGGTNIVEWWDDLLGILPPVAELIDMLGDIPNSELIAQAALQSMEDHFSKCVEDGDITCANNGGFLFNDIAKVLDDELVNCGVIMDAHFSDSGELISCEVTETATNMNDPNLGNTQGWPPQMPDVVQPADRPFLNSIMISYANSQIGQKPHHGDNERVFTLPSNNDYQVVFYWDIAEGDHFGIEDEIIGVEGATIRRVFGSHNQIGTKAQQQSNR